MASRAIVSPHDLWFSQRTAGGNNRANRLRQSIHENGFLDNADNPVNVVRTPSGLTTIDNTRVAIAQELDIEQITVVIHEFDDTLPEIMIRMKRFGDAKTWGEALEYRISHQRPDPLRFRHMEHLSVR